MIKLIIINASLYFLKHRYDIEITVFHSKIKQEQKTKNKTCIKAILK